MWSSAGARNLGAPAIPRGTSTPLSSQGQQDDMFSNAGRLPSSAQPSFRFGNQSTIGQPAPPSQPGTIDDFPPLNRSGANSSDLGQDRSAAANLMSSIGYGSQGPAASAAPPGTGGRVGNGLLNALSANNRAGSEVRSPVGTRSQEAPGLSADELQQGSPQQKADGESSVQSPIGEASGPATATAPVATPATPQHQPSNGAGPEQRGSVGTIGTVGSDAAAAATDAKPQEDEALPSLTQDPLSGMPTGDRWGMKGLRAMMNIPEYREVMSVHNLDLGNLGLDLASSEPLSAQAYSLSDGNAARPVVPKFRVPECYKVSNVGPINEKISSFNEETLMWIFYSCPGDRKQHLAAQELNNRNWRWHKLQQLWLTKDDMMLPQVLSMSHERGYYIVWDTTTWRRERTVRELQLNYADLENMAAVGTI